MAIEIIFISFVSNIYVNAMCDWSHYPTEKSIYKEMFTSW